MNHIIANKNPIANAMMKKGCQNTNTFFWILICATGP